MQRLSAFLFSAIMVAHMLLSAALAQTVEPAKDHVQDYELLSAQMRICRMAHKTDTLRAQIDGRDQMVANYRKFLSCRDKVTTGAKTLYSELFAKVRGAAGRAALKNHHAEFVVMIEAERRDNESEGAFAARLASMDDKVKIAYQRLQLEL